MSRATPGSAGSASQWRWLLVSGGGGLLNWFLACLVAFQPLFINHQLLVSVPQKISVIVIGLQYVVWPYEPGLQLGVDSRPPPLVIHPHPVTGGKEQGFL